MTWMGGGAHCRDKEASKQEVQVWGQKDDVLQFRQEGREPPVQFGAQRSPLTMELMEPDTGPLATEGSVGHGKRGSKSTLLNLCCEQKGAQGWELQDEASQGGCFLLWGWECCGCGGEGSVEKQRLKINSRDRGEWVPWGGGRGWN